MPLGFREAFKALLLPVPVEREEECLGALRASLEESRVSAEDHAVWISYQVGKWAASGVPSKTLKAAIQAAICQPAERFSSDIGGSYFDLHSMLQADFLLSHTQASAFLSHLRLIYTLADDEFMSSAQVASLVGTRDSRVGVSRQSIGKVLSKLGVKPCLTQPEVERCFAGDAVLESEVMADADLDSAAAIVGALAESLGSQIDFSAKLLDLCPEGNLQRHPPYLQMLHYQAVIAEFYDHRLTDLYEFSPRGQALLWLVDQYPDALSIAGNPFLNNAKSVEALTIGWARSKEGNFRSALALYELLAEMEELGFSARKELAQWIRLWIHRVMRLASPLENPVPEDIEGAALLGAVHHLAAAESETSGILEQRVVDALALQIYPRTEGWIVRGVGDPVNATNTSKRKLGDIDFQRVSDKRVVAFEAHAGTLSGPYLTNHMEVLSRVLETRIKEWESYSEEEGWAIDIIFVAHAFAVDAPEEIEHNGVTVRVAFWTYNDLLEAAGDEGLDDAIRSLVVGPINQKRTPNHARQRLLELSQM